MGREEAFVRPPESSGGCGRVALFLIAVPSVALAALAIWGMLSPASPPRHASRVILAPMADVGAALAQPATYATWQPEIDEVEVLEERADLVRYRERRGLAVVEVTLDRRDPSRLEARVIDSKAHARRTTYTLESEGTHTRVRAVVVDEPVSVLLRPLVEHVFDEDPALEELLAALARRFE